MADDNKLHEMVGRLKDLAIEMGRTPTKSDFISKCGFSDRQVGKFGYTVLVQGAGLEAYHVRKIDSSIFEKDITAHLESHQPKDKTPYIDVKPIHTIILGDTHFPFVHKDKLKAALDYIAFRKPKRVIQIGDLYDCFSHGKFPRSVNIYTPKEEMLEARRGAEAMWAEVRRVLPEAELHGILGNHDLRPMKRVIEQYPEAELFFDFEKWFKFDGVTTHMDARQELILEGIAYIHGYRSKLGEHMEYMRRPVVCGHSHRGGAVFKNYGDATLWELNAGYLGDAESKALSYTAQKHTHWTHGIGEVDDFGPRFVVL